jgi:hypothetical protein
VATGREARSPELNTFAAAFAVAGEKQETVADEATIALLKRFWGNPDVERGQGRNSGGRKKLKNSSIVDSMGSILPKRWAGLLGTFIVLHQLRLWQSAYT